MTRGALWGVILAGGDGTRLRPFLRDVHGTDRPKQFCAIIGTRSMLRHTLDRARWLIPAERTVTVVTAGHRPFVAGDLVAEPPRILLEQPRNRDTAPGILLPLLVILQRDPEARVVLFPSDHFILEEGRFMTHVAEAVAAIGRVPDRVALLGIVPDRPAPGYGWIEAGSPLGGSSLLTVCRFWEKPDRGTARRLFARGCLLNTFVLVASARLLWDLTRRCLPNLAGQFERIVEAWNGPDREAVLDAEYAAMRPANFSREVLEREAGRLAVLPVGGVLWSDWGEPARVVETVRRIGSTPWWVLAADHGEGERDAWGHA
ncbi:MAG: NTP transferase domain-containing protein [candidate division NC10 bacterium]|nr:NTP transferase domain-containing protein [candidate division NC10 bacterium]MBI2164039.1 NTP transferase domain-containing protein [candidate division NC10 bacterium]